MANFDGITFNEGFFEKLGRSPEVEALVVAKAERVAQNARESAPVATGEYRDNIVVEVKHQKRVVAVVRAKDPKSMLIESKRGTLARAGNKEKRSRA